MKDEFLYRLRVEPPLEFAVRLKARLDAQSRLGVKRVSRWGIPLLIFGAAFALALPDVRHGIARLMSGAGVPSEVPHEASDSPESALTEAVVTVPRIVYSNEPIETPTRARVSHPPAIVIRSRQPLIRSLPQHQAVTGGAGVLVDPQEARSVPDAPSADSAVPYMNTRVDEAQAALSLRRSLFAVMTRATMQLLATSGEGRSFDPIAAETQARRIQELALMIPEAFALDTRGVELQTEALDRIWADKAQFNADATRLGAAAAALIGSLRSGDASARSVAVGNLTQTCVGCHSAFRAEGH
jgi:cytochrome c556